MPDPILEAHVLAPDGGLPNNRWPLIVHRSALQPNQCSAAACAALFQDHGWQGAWVNGVFSYWHFHARSHEALGCIAGSAEVGFGGDAGIRTTFSAGDVVIIPAGVGHKRFSATPQFQVVGAYPSGQNGAIARPESATIAAAVAAAHSVPAPAADPVTGADGGLKLYWI